VEPPAAVEAAEGATVTLERKAVFALKPPQREKWLKKALKQAAGGQIRASDLYDVIASTRFTEDVPHGLGQRMARAVQQQLSLFSGKQQRFLSSEATLALKFGRPPAEQDPGAGKVPGGDPDPPEGAGAEGPQGTMEEEMMARCRAFVRERLRERGGSAEEHGEGAEGEAGAEPAEAAAPPPPFSAPAAAAEASPGGERLSGGGRAEPSSPASPAVCASGEPARRKRSKGSSSASSSPARPPPSSSSPSASSSSSSSPPPVAKQVGKRSGQKKKKKSNKKKRSRSSSTCESPPEPKKRRSKK